MIFTPVNVASAYEMLRDLHPFKRWKLPHADLVEFRTDMRKEVFAEHNYRSRERKPPLIRLSLVNIDHLDTFLRSIAHEMVHLAQVVNGEREGHGDTFTRRAKTVCKHFGWDYKAF